MIFWLFVLSAIVGIGLAIYLDDCCSDYSGLPAVIGILSSLVAIVMLIVIVAQNVNVDADIAKNQMRYNMLVYQYENDIYDNDNDLGKRDLMEDIQDWNEDLAYYREVQDNFWVGIFYPNIYDQFDFIELK